MSKINMFSPLRLGFFQSYLFSLGSLNSRPSIQMLTVDWGDDPRQRAKQRSQIEINQGGNANSGSIGQQSIPACCWKSRETRHKNVSYKLCYMRGKTGKINLGLIELRIDFFFPVAKWRFFGWWCLFCLIIIIVVLDTFHSLGPTVIYVYSYQSAFYSCDRMPRINTFE